MSILKLRCLKIKALKIPRSKFSSQVTKDGGRVAPSNGTSPRVALMELVNIAYEDAEKNGGSMTFEKPLGASGWDGGSNRLVLISPGKSCSNLGDDGDISSFYSLNMWGTLPPYIGFGGRWRGTPWYPKKCSWLDDDEQDTGWYCSAYIYTCIYITLSRTTCVHLLRLFIVPC